jgi:hypothetical protein
MCKFRAQAKPRAEADFAPECAVVGDGRTAKWQQPAELITVDTKTGLLSHRKNRGVLQQ